MMRRVTLAILVLAAAAAATLRGAPAGPQPASTAAADTLAIIVNRSNPVDAVTTGELRRIFMLETQSWPNGRKITVVLREKGQPERAEAIRAICGMSEPQYERHVLFQTFRGSVGWGPRSILSARAMLRFVFNAPGAIGYVRGDETDDAAKVLRIDGLLPADPKYPVRRGTNRLEAHASRR